MLNKKIILTAINLFVFTILQSQQLKSYLFEGLVADTIPYTSVKKSLLHVKEHALKNKDSTVLVKSLISLSAFERSAINYEQAFINAGEALYISEKTGSELLIAKANEEFGWLLYMYKQHDAASKHLKKAHQLYNQLYQTNKINSSQIYQSNYNLVLLAQLDKKPKILEQYINYCDTLIKQHKIPNIKNCFLNEKRASILQWKGANKKAIELLHKSISKLESLPNAVENNNYKNFLPIIYGRIAVIYKLELNNKMAEYYFKKAVQAKDITGENIFYKYFLYKKYANVLAQLKKYKSAYQYEAISNTLGHSYWNPRNEKNHSFLTVKNHFKSLLETQNKLHNKKELELEKVKNKVLQLKAYLLVITLTLILITTLLLFRQKTIKHKKKQRDSKKSIQIKNKELTYSTLQIIEKERIIFDLSDHLKKNLDNANTKQFLKRIRNNSSSLWDSFNIRFKEQNIGFYERLQRKIPNLTGTDLKLCALIKLNFSSKEMSYLLNISHGSVNVARHRLRKKMNLDKNTNLTEFINTV
jgi:DNA-binding CsgD family transcriptional regulator